MTTERSYASTRIVNEMVVMLGEMDIHEVHVNDLARRAGVAIPTVYYNFHSLNQVVAEATVDMVRQFLRPFSEAIAAMRLAQDEDDEENFRHACATFFQRSWSEAINDEIHRLAPLIAHFRLIAADDTRLRTVQAREVQDLISVLEQARKRGWIARDEDVTAFVIVHWTCVLGQAVFYHPAFGALTAIDFTSGVGRLRTQSSLTRDLSTMSVHSAVTT